MLIDFEVSFASVCCLAHFLRDFAVENYSVDENSTEYLRNGDKPKLTSCYTLLI